MAIFRKDSDALLDYKIIWDPWLGTDHIVSAQTSAIQTSPALTSAGAIRIASSLVSSNNKSHVIWLSAGENNKEYGITSRIWTSGGRRDDRSFTIRVEPR